MENNILKIIADNPALYEAVWRLVESKFQQNKIKGQMSNEMLGQIVRARIDGLGLVAEAFREIEKYKTLPKQPEIKNPAR